MLVENVSKRVLIVGALLGLIVVGLIPLHPGSTHLWEPLSLLTVIPSFLIAGAFGDDTYLPLGAFIGALMPALGFGAVARYIATTGNLLPKASIIAFVVITILSTGFAVLGWDGTVRYTSAARAMALVIQSLMPAAFLLLAGIAVRRRLTLYKSLLLHWLAFAWLSWSAFPWYGELL